MTTLQQELNLDEDTWDALCAARLHYNEGTDRRTWWHALRTYCGYRGGDNTMLRKVGGGVDAWLREHPSWRGRYS